MMDCLVLARLAALGAIVSLVTGVSTCKISESPSDLRTRILAGSVGCNSAESCSNPFILADDDGFEVTTSVTGRFETARVRADRLRGHLLALPMSAWPLGTIVTISRTDFVEDEAVVEHNFAQAERVCRSLGLDVQIRPGG
jgi:hypothetical protein